MLDAADTAATAALRDALLSGDRNRVTQLTGDGQLPLLLAISDIHTEWAGARPSPPVLRLERLV